jgi:hypothetical protein
VQSFIQAQTESRSIVLVILALRYPAILLLTDKGSNFFSKVWLYSNARLPPHLPPFKVYVPTYPLLCLAATYSERAYEPATPSTSETHIPADWRSGTKAMVLGTGRQVSGLMSSSCAPIHGR